MNQTRLPLTEADRRYHRLKPEPPLTRLRGVYDILLLNQTNAANSNIEGMTAALKRAQADEPHRITDEAIWQQTSVEEAISVWGAHAAVLHRTRLMLRTLRPLLYDEGITCQAIVERLVQRQAFWREQLLALHPWRAEDAHAFRDGVRALRGEAWHQANLILERIIREAKQAAEDEVFMIRYELDRLRKETNP